MSTSDSIHVPVKPPGGFGMRYVIYVDLPAKPDQKLLVHGYAGVV